jgi:hypothetical protein
MAQYDRPKYSTPEAQVANGFPREDPRRVRADNVCLFILFEILLFKWMRHLRAFHYFVKFSKCNENVMCSFQSVA